MPTLTCTAGWLTFTIINAIVGIALASTVFFAFYKFLTNANNLSKIRRIPASIFIMSSAMALIWIILWISESTGCLPISPVLAKYPFYLFLAIQLYVIIIIFFDQLTAVFEETPLAISNRTRLIFKALLIIAPIFIVIAISLSALGFRTIFLILGSLAVMLLLGMTISIVIMFIYKLINAYNHHTQYNEALLQSITRSTILTTLSTLSTFLNVLSLVFEGVDPGIYVIIEAIMMYLDVYTSALCVIMCFVIFKPYYDILCGCLDGMCVACWTSLIIKSAIDQDTKMMTKDLENHATEIATSVNSLPSKTES